MKTERLKVLKGGLVEIVDKNEIIEAVMLAVCRDLYTRNASGEIIIDTKIHNNSEHVKFLRANLRLVSEGD